MKFAEAFGIIFFQLLIQQIAGSGTVGTRSETPLEIEVLAVSDYSAFQKWYELLDPNLPHADKITFAKQNLTSWLGAMIHSANLVYKHLEADGIYISIKLIDLIIMTTVEDSPWTEKTKFMVNSTYMIDSELVHPLFQEYSTSLQLSIPHDHAMLLTRYTIIHGENGTKTYAGNAYMSAECFPNSQSIVKDSGYSFTANVIAHEIGHSLGCEHDGDNNTCKAGQGYLMEEITLQNSTRKWMFSACSVQYIKDFIGELNRKNKNCLLHTDDTHPKPELTVASQQWVGNLYSHDEQCVIHNGQGSYLRRDKYMGNFTSMCLNMRCSIPHKNGEYSSIEAGDGTPCASEHVCVSGVCVHDSAAAKIDNHCIAGDQRGEIFSRMICKQIVMNNPNLCLRQDIKFGCCASCRNVTTTPVPVDSQCMAKFGTESHMCRNMDAYDSTYSIFCGKLYCKNITADNWCNVITAYDKTPCENKKWCLNGQCVSDLNAPAIQNERCVPGDHMGIVYNHMTCEQIVRLTPSDCLWPDVKSLCCESCQHVSSKAIPVDLQCQAHFGAGSHMCRNMKAYDSTYSILCDNLYCKNTTLDNWCNIITAYDKTPCGNRKWCLDGNCVSDSNAPDIQDERCIPGDHMGIVYNHMTCEQIVRLTPSDCLRPDVKSLCCESCQHVNSAAIPVDQQCQAHFGSGSHMCRNVQDYHSTYSVLCSKLYCRNTTAENWCNIITAYDKTPCANGKWCSGGQCVSDPNAPVILDERCVPGDRSGNVFNHMTCKQIVENDPNDCLQEDVKSLCCASCQQVTTTAVPVDTQCKKTFGTGSYMCRNVKDYESTYSVLCDRLYCSNTTAHNWCNSITAYDKTPCGNGKWCIDGKCVNDHSAPSVPDNCPMGNRENDPRVSNRNLTCAEIRQPDNNFACYDNFTKLACCATSNDIKRAETGCEYGDKISGCDSRKCGTYNVDTRKACCLSCRSSAIVG